MFAVEDGVARRRTVVLSQRADTTAAVQQGLAPDDTVILFPDGCDRRWRARTTTMIGVPSLVDVALFAAGFVSWAISTLAAGGGSVLIVAAVAVILRGQAIAPVVTVTSVLASPARMILLWRFIDWRVVCWYLPGATAGALLGGWTFAHIGTQWLQIVLALFLISTAWQYRMGVRPRSFTMRLPWFMPVSLLRPDFGGGGSQRPTGKPVLSQLRADEGGDAGHAGGELAGHPAREDWWLCDVRRVALAAGAARLGGWRRRDHRHLAGHPWLRHLSSFRFRQLAVLVMLFGRLLILWQQRKFLVDSIERRLERPLIACKLTSMD